MRKKSPFKGGPPCHCEAVEITEGLFCGSEKDIVESVRENHYDVLIPLNSLDADIWKFGFRGQILYYPISDFSILPDDVLEDLVSKILIHLKDGKKIGLFCGGGHGRTGYVASVVMGKLGIDDPIAFVRGKYCQQAVESDAQIRHIAKVLNKPKLKGMYHEMPLLANFDLPGRFSLYGYGLKASYMDDEINCGDCALYIRGYCMMSGESVDANASACINATFE